VNIKDQSSEDRLKGGKFETNEGTNNEKARGGCETTKRDEEMKAYYLRFLTTATSVGPTRSFGTKDG